MSREYLEGLGGHMRLEWRKENDGHKRIREQNFEQKQNKSCYCDKTRTHRQNTCGTQAHTVCGTVCSLFKSPLSYEKKDFRLKSNRSLPRRHHAISMRFSHGIIYSNKTQKIAFELDENYTQLPSFYLPSIKGTKYARYIGISNIFICLRGFLLLFAASP
jgi:hypothetical protein